ncbi:MAG: hypothetical protein IC227_10145 [Enterococcus lacertideformus]|uniref:Competence protein ComGG n=1 Tax=Enterococcus lacertideformus TaxID=2771493 RepID=A0A931B1C1_9ENTE|nr:hypothetical protein [Enterococcus lacertideformus]
MKESGLNHQHKRLFKGNILFSTLVLFLICSSLSIIVIESYRLTVDMNYRVKNYYLAKIMKQMFLSEINNLKDSGKYQYTLGTISYNQTNKQLNIEIKIGTDLFKFTESVKDDTESNTEKK